MSENVTGAERAIDVKDIDPQHRHTIISHLSDNLLAGNSLQQVADHDPKPLRFQLEAKHDSCCQWTELAEGPGVWRGRLRQTRRSGTGHD